MARDDKPVRLRTVDEDDIEPIKVIRLDNSETEKRALEPQPIKLDAPKDEEDGVSQRLSLPDKDEVEFRTHQPGIDMLIDAEIANPDQMEENWGEATVFRNPIPWGWFALIALTIAGAVVWSLTQMADSKVQAQQIKVETKSTLVDEEQEDIEAEKLIENIEKTIKSFLGTTSVESLGQMVRQPERVIPLMRAYYANQKIQPKIFKSTKVLQPLTIGKRGNFWITSSLLLDGKTQNMIIEIDPSGEPKIDWETFVCYQPMKWDEFANKRPAGSSLDFRVYAEKDNFNSHEFADANQWLSFRLTAIDSIETLFGYARADSQVGAELMHLIHENNGNKPSLVLRLSIPQGLKSRRGVVIEKIMSTQWLYLDPPATDP